MSLDIKDIHWSVGWNCILQWASLSLPSGRAVGLVGPNWCWKTSLLNVINGFQHAQEGEILRQWDAISKRSVEKRACSWIGRVFQSFGIFRSLTVYENLALAFFHKLNRWQKRKSVHTLPWEMKTRIQDLLEEIHLHDKQNHLAWSLSWGQMRLLELWRLYLQDTQLYLLDEPTAGVSPKLKWSVIGLIKKIIARGHTVLIVEHDFWFLGEFVDEICVMNEGKIVARGTHQQIKENEMVKKVYFG